MAGGRDIRAGRAFIELSIRSKVVRGLRNAQRRLRAFGQGMSSVGRMMVGVGAAITAPFVLATRHFMKAGDELPLSYWFTLPGKPSDCRLVYEVPSDIIELTVPFELKDLPLP